MAKVPSEKNIVTQEYIKSLFPKWNGMVSLCIFISLMSLVVNFAFAVLPSQGLALAVAPFAVAASSGLFVQSPLPLLPSVPPSVA